MPELITASRNEGQEFGLKLLVPDLDARTYPDQVAASKKQAEFLLVARLAEYLAQQPFGTRYEVGSHVDAIEDRAGRVTEYTYIGWVDVIPEQPCA